MRCNCAETRKKENMNVMLLNGEIQLAFQLIGSHSFPLIPQPYRFILVRSLDRRRQNKQTHNHLRFCYSCYQSTTPANSESNEDDPGSQDQSFDQDKDYLRPPALSRQFLLSPPPSPPVGWEPPTEGQPMINYELLAALSRMVPGQPLELHPPEQDRPAIVVHICDEADPVSSLFPNLNASTKIPQTQRPPVKCTSSASSACESSQPSNQSATA